MSKLLTLAFWKAAGVRAVKTFAQTIVGLLVGDQAGLVHTKWGALIALGGLAALVSILTSVASVDDVAPAAAAPEEVAP